MPHAALCVSRHVCWHVGWNAIDGFNSARSIVCVETKWDEHVYKVFSHVSMPHAALCVSRRADLDGTDESIDMFQCRTQHCVCRDDAKKTYELPAEKFQCRTQHCVCRDETESKGCRGSWAVSMPHAALCVSRLL